MGLGRGPCICSTSCRAFFLSQEDNGGEMDDEQEDADFARNDATEEEAVPGDDEPNRDEEY